MSKPKLNDAIIKQILDNNPGLSNVAIGDLLGISEASVRRAIKRIRKTERALIPNTLLDPNGIERPLKVVGNCMISADWHVPLFDVEYSNTLIKTAVDNEIRTLVIAGDFFNFDALSQFDHKQEENLKNEWMVAVETMRILLASFDDIVYLWGNHDARLHKALGFAIQFQDAMRMVFGELGAELLHRIHFTNLDHCWLDPTGNTHPTDWYYVCHPASYTRVPLTTARNLCAKVNAHVITAHSHHCAVGYAIDGYHVAAEIGGLFDRTRVSYLQRSTTHPTWQQGFAYVKDGALKVHSPGWSLV